MLAAAVAIKKTDQLPPRAVIIKPLAEAYMMRAKFPADARSAYCVAA